MSYSHSVAVCSIGIILGFLSQNIINVEDLHIFSKFGALIGHGPSLESSVPSSDAEKSSSPTFQNMNMFSFVAVRSDDVFTAEMEIFPSILPKKYFLVSLNNDVKENNVRLQLSEDPVAPPEQFTGSLRDFKLGRTVRIGEFFYTLLSYANQETKEALNTEKNSTYAMVKPDAMQHLGQVVKEIQSRMHIAQMKMVHLTVDQAEHFYEEHQGRPFFKNLVSYITRAPVLALKLEGNNAVTTWREHLGPTDSSVARAQKPNSIRAKFGKDKTENAAHGSDSFESAQRELSLLFPRKCEQLTSLSISARHLLNSQTSILILPHVYNSVQRDSSLGYLLTYLTEFHRCSISALELIYLNHLEAAGLVTGKFVLQNIPSTEKIAALMEGASVVVKLSPVSDETDEDFLQRLPDILGPENPVVARRTAIESVRARFGEDKILNGVFSPYYDESQQV